MDKHFDTPEEQSFQEGMQDNSVKITDDNNADPDQDALNRNPKITNSETQDFIKQNHEGRPNDGEAIMNRVDNEQTAEDNTVTPDIPDNYFRKKVETQDPTMKEDE